MAISNLFLRVGVLALIFGMGVGMYMGGNGDFSLRHTHAHTNLVGWASMMIFGFFYRFFPEAGQGWAARLHAGLAIPGLILMIIGMIGTAKTENINFLLTKIGGELLMALGVLVFAVLVFRATGRRSANSEPA